MIQSNLVAINKSSRVNIRQDASLHLIFKQQGFCEECVGIHLICYFPYYSFVCTFWPYHPYVLVQLFSCIVYLYIIIIEAC